MTEVRRIATALMCCFGGINGVFYALNMRRVKNLTGMVYIGGQCISQAERR
jgi:hypothetical protein